ncbi:pyrroloquinoline quinone biosynthesis protein PqqB [Tateyamaria sp. ANG-S1]|uniref:pyrroloquinoline quinone biosynthesis protein PqqB n=1 Tax=Tateyamaria sp. ANG-S1 TaxID=1577905 RepID=UPI0005809D05|nr:pyrroloquinoline quinone biosynthesis protein PqqB [Tateyamaria sp. ANG-S1]KIC45554.1 pyrroloquinoline quinone biosynthesis protein PqqB [Tateyamaria sp. ANG-S1]
MRLIVLGAAAGGGLPQWNCGCRNCADARAGVIPRMTQSSVAVSVDGTAWVVLNASPDIRAQVDACAAMHPPELRGSPIVSVVLTNGDIDHIAGLLTLREKTEFDVYATSAGLDILRSNSVFGVLDPALVAQHQIALDMPFEPVRGLTITPFAVPGKVALFLEGDTLNLEEVGEQTVGLLLDSGTSRAAYVPGCAAIPDWLLDRLGGVDLLLFDGTVWNNDDMQRTGTGEKTGARMGHVPLNGELGSLERLSGVEGRKVFIHINNTNPILQPDSPERAEVTAKGWDIAFDGMEIAL